MTAERARSERRRQNRVTVLLMGRTSLVGLAGPASAVRPMMSVGGGITNAEEETEIQAVNDWVESQGLPRGVVSCDLAEPPSGGEARSLVPPTTVVSPHETPHETPHVAPHVAELVKLIGTAGEMASPELLRHLGLKDRKHLRERYLTPCLEEGWIEMTLPDKPRSRNQRYRLSVGGRELLSMMMENGGAKS